MTSDRVDADIIVIGLSPAGMMAARNASRGGAKVTVIDRKEEPGIPPHPANTFFRAMIDRADEEIDSRYVIHNLRGARIVAPSGSGVVVESPGYFIDRKKFDEIYTKRLQEEDVDIRLGIEAYNVIRGQNSFTVSTSEGSLSSKIVIISDGINSKMASLLGMRPVKYPQDIAWAMEAEVTADGIGSQDLFEYYVGSVAPGWKSTYSPCGGDRATLGVYVRRNGTDVSSFFDRWVDKFKRDKGISDLEVGERKTGGDPIATIPSQIVTDGVMITGGAAGQSGIGYGMRSGQMCGDVAAEAIKKGNVSADFLSEYKKIWNREFRSEYYLGRLALEALRKMEDDEINSLMDTFDDQDISDIKGSPLQKALHTGSIMLKKNPGSILAMRSILRRK